MIFNSRTGKPKNALLRKLMRARTLEEALDFKYLRRVSKNGQVCYVSKKRLQMLQRCGERVARFNEKMRQRRKREAATARRLLGGKGNHKRAEIAREIWKHRPRAPIGSLATDRALIAAMWPVAWRPAREIGERIDWTQFGPARSGRSPHRLVAPLHRLIAHGMAEKMMRGSNHVRGVHGRVATQFFRLTPAVLDLRMEIEVGLVPKWECHGGRAAPVRSTLF